MKSKSKLKWIWPGISLLVATAVLLWRGSHTPFPSKRLASDTVWRLDHIVVQNEIQTSFEDTLLLQFTSPDSYRGFDGCNHFCWSGQPLSLWKKILNTPQPITLTRTLQLCRRITIPPTSETPFGFVHSLLQIESYKVYPDELQLYNSQDTARIMVFHPMTESTTLNISCP